MFNIILGSVSIIILESVFNIILGCVSSIILESMFNIIVCVPYYSMKCVVTLFLTKSVIDWKPKF